VLFDAHGPYTHVRIMSKGDRVYIDEIPKSASGKILRRVLRDRAKNAENGVRVLDAVGEKAKL
jgi:acyl-coenzyme A synthetase/AMP-(fatty) acid ligase